MSESMHVDSLEDFVANAFEGRGENQLKRSYNNIRQSGDDVSNTGIFSSILIKLKGPLVYLSLLFNFGCSASGISRGRASVAPSLPYPR